MRKNVCVNIGLKFYTKHYTYPGIPTSSRKLTKKRAMKIERKMNKTVGCFKQVY